MYKMLTFSIKIKTWIKIGVEVIKYNDKKMDKSKAPRNSSWL